MSFVVNQSDRVYETNLGSDTALKAQALTAFSPDSAWLPVAP